MNHPTSVLVPLVAAALQGILAREHHDNPKSLADVALAYAIAAADQLNDYANQES